jgi:hypoxanthine-DNA glycosylase
MKKESFKPLIDINTEILILGTIPSDLSLKTGEYYANTKNQFWKIIFKLFNNGKTEYSYKNKTELLLKNRIGLWDVLLRAERAGSIDSNIQNEEFNDFNKLFRDYGKIKTVIFNGQKAAEFFRAINVIHVDKNYHILPSTSSANTSKSFDKKLNYWGDILIK